MTPKAQTADRLFCVHNFSFLQEARTVVTTGAGFAHLRVAKEN
jgi:hypothetical protein